MSSSGAGATEMLNTDIMRFFAIMALCMMAVFALVQSTASKTVENSEPQLIVEENLRQEIKRLEKKRTDLEQELNELKAKISQQEKSQQQKSKQQFVEQELSYAGQSLVKAQSTIDEKNLQEARKKSLLAKVSLDVAEKVMDKTKAAVNKVTQAFPTKTQKSQPRKKGFMLRFADSQTLFSLIQQQQVQFYLIADSLSWSYSSQGGDSQFVKQRPQGQFYQMTNESVPKSIVRSADRVVSHHGGEGPLFGVTLPSSLQHEIRTCMQQSQGGALIIHGDGHLQCPGG